MPSTTKAMRGCPKCYVGIKQTNCPTCGTEGILVHFYKLTVPKMNNRRAWKRLLTGERYWDRRKVKRAALRTYNRGKPTIEIYDEEREVVRVGNNVAVRWHKKPGSEREVDNYGCLPNVDLGS